MTGRQPPKELSREEDYRDYEDRDLRDGWPYSDADSSGPKSPKNAAYGESPANFDENSDPGFLIEEAAADGREQTNDTTKPLQSSRIDSDELEAELTDKLSASGIDVETIDIHVENGTVTVEGSVDTEESAQRIAELIGSVAGVAKVINQLEALGIDAHMPRDG